MEEDDLEAENFVGDDELPSSGDDDQIVFWKYDGIVGLSFSDTITYSFLMRVTFKNKADVSTYLAEEITPSMSFADGTISYPNDKPPTLNRKGLEWEKELINEEIKVVWNRKGSLRGTEFFGKIKSYDDELKTHNVVFDDGECASIDLFNCYDLVSEWQIIPNRAQEKVDTEEEEAKKVARDQRVVSRQRSKALTDAESKKPNEPRKGTKRKLPDSDLDTNDEALTVPLPCIC